MKKQIISISIQALLLAAAPSQAGIIIKPKAVAIIQSVQRHEPIKHHHPAQKKIRNPILKKPWDLKPNVVDVIGNALWF